LGLKSKVFGKKYYERRLLDLHIKNAEIVKEAILKLQGLFIKVGQLLSILTNFLPEAFQKPLEALQDQIPARSYTEIEERIKEELNPQRWYRSYRKSTTPKYRKNSRGRFDRHGKTNPFGVKIL